MGQNIDDNEVGTTTNEVNTIIKEIDNDKDKGEEGPKEAQRTSDWKSGPNGHLDF